MKTQSLVVLLHTSLFMIVSLATGADTSFAQQTASTSDKEGATITITGIIKDRRTGEALPNANVFIKGTKKGTTSSTNGYFTIFNVPNDTCVIVGSYIGYRSKEISLKPNQLSSRLTIELEEVTVELRSVTIEAETDAIMKVSGSQVSSITISPQQLVALPNVGDKDIMRAFQLMPGVSASNENSSGLYVRGGTPDQNLIVYDGFTVYHVDHLYGFFSAFNANAVKDVQLHKSGFGSKFGERLSSVTEITGKDGSKKASFQAHVTLLSADAIVQGPIGKKITYLFAFRRSWEGGIYSKIFDKFNTQNSSTVQRPARPGGFGGSDNTVASYFYDLNGKLTYHPGDDDVISLSLYNGTDNLDNGQKPQMPSFGGSGRGFNFEVNDLTNYGNIGSSLKWSRKWSPEFTSTTLLSYSNYYSNRDRTNKGSVTAPDGTTREFKQGTLENNDLYDVSLKNDYQYDISQELQQGFGLFATRYDIAYSFAQNDTIKILDRGNTGILLGGYEETKLRLFDERLRIQPGLRATWFDQTKSLYLEPRLTAQYQYSEELTFNGATGFYRQFANRITREDILSGSRDFWILSDNSRIPVSSAIHFVTGASYDAGGYLFSAEAYYKILKNLSEYSLRYTPNFQQRGLTYEENFFHGSGYARGIEFLTQKKYGAFSGWISYTLGQARNKFSVYSQTEYPADQDVTHEVKLVSLYTWKEWDFSATWIYATGRPYTAPLGAYTIKLLDGTTQDYYVVGEKNSNRYPAYHRLDIAANYKFIDEDDHRELGSIGLSLFNLYGRKNVWYKEFQIAGGEVYETNINFLGFTPNITLSWFF